MIVYVCVDCSLYAQIKTQRNTYTMEYLNHLNDTHTHIYGHSSARLMSTTYAHTHIIFAYAYLTHIGGFLKIVTPKHGWFMIENY